MAQANSTAFLHERVTNARARTEALACILADAAFGWTTVDSDHLAALTRLADAIGADLDRVLIELGSEAGP